MERRCKKCHVDKLLTEYHNKKDGAGGFHSYCKECVNGAYDSLAYKKYKLNKNYGITLKQYNDMLSQQHNMCAICAEPLYSPHVDHCHNNGKVRGLLCINCNQGIGKFKDNINILQQAIDYLRNHMQ